MRSRKMRWGRRTGRETEKGILWLFENETLICVAGAVAAARVSPRRALAGRYSSDDDDDCGRRDGGTVVSRAPRLL